MARVLIAGGGGFLGQEVRAALSQHGCQVTLMHRKQSCSTYVLYPNENIAHIDWPSGIKEFDFSMYDFVFYLSHAPVTESQSLQEVLEINYAPLELMVTRINAQKVNLQLVFVSSQSALQSVESNYGKLKRISEELLLTSAMSGVIIRPGLIFGPGGKGLFNSIKQLVSTLPIIPLIGSSSSVIQPLFVKDFTKILLHVSGITLETKNSKMRVIELADRPVSFHTFVKSLAMHMKKKRVFVPIPNWIAYSGLWVLEHVFKFKKITTSSLFGFLQLSPLDHEAIWQEHNISPTNLDVAMSESV